ncbi:hypothetical protein D049_3029A, partial [Vibrio parahaemolyticus VPTS-2010]|jgi:epidermal growth factor receptor substrate 15
MSNP